MKIKVDDNGFFIESGYKDTYILKQYTGGKDKKGEPKYISHGYFKTISATIKKYFSLEISKSSSETLEELLDYLRNIDKRIDDLAEKLLDEVRK